MISKRHAMVNNPQVGNFSSEQAPSYIGAWDANNVYGFSISQLLPMSHFVWVWNEE